MRRERGVLQGSGTPFYFEICGSNPKLLKFQPDVKLEECTVCAIQNASHLGCIKELGCTFYKDANEFLPSEVSTLKRMSASCS